MPHKSLEGGGWVRLELIWAITLGSISAFSQVRSLILPGRWVRAHFPEQSAAGNRAYHNLYKSSTKKKISQVGERAQVIWRQEPIDEMQWRNYFASSLSILVTPRMDFFHFLTKFLSRESPMRGTFSCLLSCARGMKPQRKQTYVKDVQVVVTSQKMEQVKNTRASAPFRVTFYYVWTAGERSKTASW